MYFLNKLELTAEDLKLTDNDKGWGGLSIFGKVFIPIY